MPDTPTSQRAVFPAADLKRFLPTPALLILILVCIVLALLAPDSTALLRYQRDAFSAGEVWRLLTANLVHSNVWHLLLNLLAVIVLRALFSALLPTRAWWTVALFCAFGNVLGVHLFSDFDWYVGMSGALYGVAVFGGAALLMAGEKLIGAGVLIWVIGRTVYEQIYGASADLAALIAVDVATSAHLSGVISGVLATALLLKWPPRHAHASAGTTSETR